MNGLLKSFFMGIFLIAILYGTSFGHTYPGSSSADLTSLENAIFGYGSLIDNFDFNGNYRYTGVGFEAAHDNNFSRTGQDGYVIYDNDTENNVQGLNYGVWSDSFAWNEMIFNDTSDNNSDNTHIKAFLLDEDWVFGDTTWAAGLFIIGWGDGALDGDFDDLIIAAIPNPEPATMLLFGFGLLSLAGVSRKINNH